MDNIHWISALTETLRTKHPPPLPSPLWLHPHDIDSGMDSHYPPRWVSSKRPASDHQGRPLVSPCSLETDFLLCPWSSLQPGFATLVKMRKKIIGHWSPLGRRRSYSGCGQSQTGDHRCGTRQTEGLASRWTHQTQTWILAKNQFNNPKKINFPVIRCCFDNLVLDVGHNGGYMIHDILHGVGQVNHEVDVDGVDPPLGDELNPVGDGRPRQQPDLLASSPTRWPFHQG